MRNFKIPGAAPLVAGLLFACLLALATPSALAQDYPTKPVTLITPAAAGNSPDVATRIVADRLSQIWKHQIVVLNRPGAGGLIAAQAAAGAANDGYTLYMTQASTYTVLPVEQEGKMTVNLQTAFAPIALVANSRSGSRSTRMFRLPTRPNSLRSPTRHRVACCLARPIAAARRT